uniref:Uncharacterized protein n=1 Tax=Ditylenchus dipsaci TaxID=166011 RepID=A0A915CPB5_9BILA
MQYLTILIIYFLPAFVKLEMSDEDYRMDYTLIVKDCQFDWNFLKMNARIKFAIISKSGCEKEKEIKPTALVIQVEKPYVENSTEEIKKQSANTSVNIVTVFKKKVSYPESESIHGRCTILCRLLVLLLWCVQPQNCNYFAALQLGSIYASLEHGQKQEEEWDRSTCTFCHPKPTKPVEKNGFWSQCTYKQFCDALYTTLYSCASGYKNTAVLLTDLYNHSKIDGTVVARENNYVIFDESAKKAIQIDHIHLSTLPHIVRNTKSCAAILDRLDRDVLHSLRLEKRFSKSLQGLITKNLGTGQGISNYPRPLISYDEDIVQPVTEKEHLKKPASVPCWARNKLYQS